MKMSTEQVMPMSELDMLAFVTEKWGPAPRLAKRIPFGYMENPEDETLLLPMVFELEALEKAKEHIKKGHSLRNVAEWLSDKTGRSISHQGLKIRIKSDKSTKSRALALRRWAESTASAAKKVRDFDLKHGNSVEWYTDWINYLLEASKGPSEKGGTGR